MWSPARSQAPVAVDQNVPDGDVLLSYNSDSQTYLCPSGNSFTQVLSQSSGPIQGGSFRTKTLIMRRGSIRPIDVLYLMSADTTQENWKWRQGSHSSGSAADMASEIGTTSLTEADS